MNKFITLLWVFTFVIFNELFSQITITADYIPIPPKNIVSAVSSSNLNLITTGDSGANKRWDYSYLQNDLNDTIKLVTPDSTPYFSSYPGANLTAILPGNLFTYLKTSSTSTLILGVTGDFTGMGSTLSANYLSPFKMMKFPSYYQMSYFDSATMLTSAWRFDTTITIPPGITADVDSMRISRKTTKEVVFDGWGKIITPIDSFECIREKSDEINKTSVQVYLKSFFYTGWFTVPSSMFPVPTTQKNTYYNYMAKGVAYPVVQIVTDSNGTVTNANYQITPTSKTSAPECNFMADSLIVSVNDTVRFTDLSLAQPNSWKWDFGDSVGIDTIQDPVYVYKKAGLYSVTLIAKNDIGSDTLTKLNYIKVKNIAPIADFDAIIYNGFTIQVTDKSLNNPAQWEWDFGDSTSNDTSTLQNPSYTYSAAGNYKVCLKVSNDAGSNQLCMFIFVDGLRAPECDFTADSTLVMVFDTVQFNDLSGYIPTSWLWDFGDGIGNSTLQNPSYVFTKSGFYTIKLIVTNDKGSDTLIKSDYIRVNNYVPEADFSFEKNVFTIQLTDKSLKNPDKWEWDFGDSTANDTSTMQNPSYTYSAAGNYKVCLKVSNDAGSNQLCMFIKIEGVGFNESEKNVFLIYNIGDGIVFMKNNHTVRVENIYIHNILGEKIISFPISSNQDRYYIKTEFLSSGVYLYEIKDPDNKNISSGKFVK